MSAKSPLGKLIQEAYGGSEPVELGALMNEIQRQAGSGRKAAKMVGVGETTWRRWKSGNTTPKAVNLFKAQSAVRAVRAANYPLTVERLRFKMQDRRENRSRTIRGQQLGLRAMDVAAVQRVYIQDGPDAAAMAMIQVIRDDFYQDYFKGLHLPEEDQPDDPEAYGGTVVAVSW